MKFASAETVRFAGQVLRILAVVAGGVEVTDAVSNLSLRLQAGQFGLIPASLTGVEIKAQAQTTFLCVEAN